MCFSTILVEVYVCCISPDWDILIQMYVYNHKVSKEKKNPEMSEDQSQNLGLALLSLRAHSWMGLTARSRMGLVSYLDSMGLL